MSCTDDIDHLAVCDRCQRRSIRLRFVVEAIVNNDDLTSGEVRRLLKEALK